MVRRLDQFATPDPTLANRRCPRHVPSETAAPATRRTREGLTRIGAARALMARTQALAHGAMMLTAAVGPGAALAKPLTGTATGTKKPG